MNIPGPEKRSNPIDAAFFRGVNRVDAALHRQHISVKKRLIRQCRTGSEGFWLMDANAYAVKALTVELEDSCAAARLFDMDVVTSERIVSRRELGYPPRKCLICEDVAHVCARSQRHDMAALLTAVANLLNDKC
jgi:holo-ACP synthase CitX